MHVSGCYQNICLLLMESTLGIPFLYDHLLIRTQTPYKSIVSLPWKKWEGIGKAAQEVKKAIGVCASSVQGLLEDT